MPAALTSDVTALADFTDEHIDEIFAGSSIDAGELVAFVRRVKETFVEAPDDSVERRHVEAIIQLSMTDGEQWQGGVRRGSSLWEAEARPAPWPHVGARLGRRLAAAVLVLAVVSGGLAGTGNLPDGMQSVAAKIAQRFGITLEAPEQRSDNRDERSEGTSSHQGNGDRTDEGNDPAHETSGREEPKGNSSYESGGSQRGDGSRPQYAKDDGDDEGRGTGTPDYGAGKDGPPPGKPEGPPPGKPEGPPPGKPEGPPPDTLNEKGGGKPDDAGNGKPDDAGNDKPKDAGNNKPKDAGNDKPKDAGNDKPKDAGNGKPEDAGNGKPDESPPGTP
jgi:hypothetical protein